MKNMSEPNNLPNNLKTELGKAVGPDVLNRMFADRGYAEQNLGSADATCRSAAIMVMAHHWGPSESFKEACKRVAVADSAPIVRECAFSCFCSCYRGVEDASVGELAAVLTYDNSQRRELRCRAYRVLFDFHARHRITVSLPPSPDSPNFRFPEDVDWHLVDTFLQRPGAQAINRGSYGYGSSIS